MNMGAVLSRALAHQKKTTIPESVFANTSKHAKMAAVKEVKGDESLDSEEIKKPKSRQAMKSIKNKKANEPETIDAVSTATTPSTILMTPTSPSGQITDSRARQ